MVSRRVGSTTKQPSNSAGRSSLPRPYFNKIPHWATHLPPSSSHLFLPSYYSSNPLPHTTCPKPRKRVSFPMKAPEPWPSAGVQPRKKWGNVFISQEPQWISVKARILSLSSTVSSVALAHPWPRSAVCERAAAVGLGKVGRLRGHRQHGRLREVYAQSAL